MEMTVKAFLQTAEGDVEVRRLPLSVNAESTKVRVFKTLVAQIAKTFPYLKGKTFSLMWKDSDGDMILMSSDEELQDALASATNEVLHIYITVGLPDPNTDKAAKNDEAQMASDKQASKSNHDREDPYSEENWPFMGPFGMYGPPPPFHPRGRRGGRGGPGGCPPCGMMHGFHQPPFSMNGHPPPPPPFMGENGEPMGPPTPPFPGFPVGPMRKRGHHHGPHFGPHHGPHFGHKHGGPMGPFFHGHGMHGSASEEEANNGCQGRKGWKRALKEAIPQPYRRWAKAFIRNWRLENLKDATTSSSDSDTDKVKKVNREACGVPEVYQQWLEIMLPRWHKTWGGQKPLDEGERQKNVHKDAVPVEFRKWVRMYLNKHFGQRESPKLARKREGSCKRDQQAGCPRGAGNCMRKEKVNQLVTAVPATHRRWARKFILAWRLENKIPTEPVSTSESEDSDLEGLASKAGIHEDYGHWLRKFLPRWHMWHGQFDKQNTCGDFRGGMERFKDTVPMTFRRWVRFYLGKHYSEAPRVDGKPANDASRYQVWLQAFKKKWLSEKQARTDSDVLCMTSSDEEATASDGEMESDLKKLRLSDQPGDKDAFKKWVRFEPQEFTSDSDFTDVDNGRTKGQGKDLNPQFRKFAWNALQSWDGQSGDSTQQQPAPAEQEIPPHVYHWMSKMMAKKQMKEAKQERKMMKKQMKAAIRLAKQARRGF